MSLSGDIFTAADLRSGKLYCVTRDFKNYDGAIYLAGERWCFLAKNFLPYEDRLTVGHPLAMAGRNEGEFDREVF